MNLHAFTTAALLALPLFAQDDPNFLAQDAPSARWRIALGLGAGSLSYENDNYPDSDSAGAGAFRLGFEGTSSRGFGGGMRLESFAATDLQLVPASNAFDFGMGTLFGHFTYRIQQSRFAMPVRVGLLANAATQSNSTVGAEPEYTASTVGVLAEIAPEFTLARRGSTSWTAYGEVGVGGGATTLESDDTNEQWDTSTSLFGLEVGTRVYFGICELSLAYVGRWQSMDRTDPGDQGSGALQGYDASFQGAMLGFAVVF